MLEKKKKVGSRLVLVTKLRSILLLEADLNLNKADKIIYDYGDRMMKYIRK